LNPESERCDLSVLPDIDPSFPLTCENISILRTEPEESVARVTTKMNVPLENFLRPGTRLHRRKYGIFQKDSVPQA
jgi:hypothetical protein